MTTKHQGHFARKRFGQNFLVDRGVIDSIVDVIAPKRGERMVEIGPGLAAITEPLIERLATPESPLHAVELDRDLIGRLEKRFGDKLVVHSADALDFDFASLALVGEKPSLRIVGNLLREFFVESRTVQTRHIIIRRVSLLACPGVNFGSGGEIVAGNGQKL